MVFPPLREQGSPPDSQRSSTASGCATRPRPCSSRKELAVPSEVVSGQTTEGLPIAPSLGPALSVARVPPERALVDRRVVFICALSILVAIGAGFVAQALTRLIGVVTNLAFYGRVSATFASPAGNRLGPLVLLVPVAGAVVVGLMARYGSAAIRGHGIPEAMEQVLLNKSRIP